MRKIIAKAREYGPTETRVFYSDEFRLRNALSRAIRECEAQGRPISALHSRPEKNLADAYLITDALITFFTANPRHELFIIASGDNAYTSPLRAIRERAGEDAACIFGLERTMANLIKHSPFISHGLVYLDDTLGLRRPTDDSVSATSVPKLLSPQAGAPATAALRVPIPPRPPVARPNPPRVMPRGAPLVPAPTPPRLRPPDANTLAPDISGLKDTSPNKIRIEELARELAVEVGVIFQVLRQLGVQEKTTDLSTISLEIASVVRDRLRRRW